MSNTRWFDRIVYCSRAEVKTDSVIVISELINLCQRNNARDGISGALIAHNGWFLQVLEGKASALDNLVRRLRVDPRHSEIEFVSHRADVDRVFGDWTMLATRINPALEIKLNRLIFECRSRPEITVDGLIRIVNDHKLPTPGKLAGLHV